MKARLIVLTLFLAPAFWACGGPEPDRSYAGTARYEYELGLEALESGDHIAAMEHLSRVKNKYAYSQYAALAELRIGDSYFEQQKYAEAVDTYRTFVQRRPNHEEVDYASWRIAKSYLEQIPSDFFLFPPPYERDRGSIIDAERAFSRLLRRFPGGRFDERAKKGRARCRTALAQYELYVARFYLTQERHLSARGRLETVFQDFDDVATPWREAALLLTEVYVQLSESRNEGPAPLPDGRERAERVASKLQETAPGSVEAQSARSLLSRGL